MEFNNVDWVEVYNWARIIIPALAFVFAVYKYKKETSYKTTIQDFEQINKYFSKDGLKGLKNHSNLAKDVACETVSFFKGNKFTEIEFLLDWNIHLNELRKIMILKKSQLISFDPKKDSLEGLDMNVKEKYKKKYFVRLTGSAKGYRITCWCFLFIYVGVLIWFFYFNSTGTKLESIVLMFLLIAAFEIPMLLKIEKRELVEWAEEFKKKKNINSPTRKER